MVRQVKDRLGGDAGLLKAVEELTLTSEEAVAILDDAPRRRAKP